MKKHKSLKKIKFNWNIPILLIVIAVFVGFSFFILSNPKTVYTTPSINQTNNLVILTNNNSMGDYVAALTNKSECFIFPIKKYTNTIIEKGATLLMKY